MPHPANTPNTLIEVPTFCENLKSAETFLSTNWAVLLQGESSSGKTILSSELARRHNASLKAINVDDNFDSKDLLGKFSATDVPGVFEWVAGPITSAVKDGTWVLMEDVDLASFDVFSVLLPLIITGKLFVADKGVTLDAHPNFRLIATQQISLVGKNKILTTKKTLSIPNAEAWPTVIVETPTTEEKLTIIKTVFPYTPDVPLQQLLLNIPVHQCGLRDMLKWAKRVSVHITPEIFEQQRISGGFLSSSLNEKVFEEAYDCFGALHPKSPEQDILIETLAKCCNIPNGVAVTLLDQHRPELIAGRTELSIGRARLPMQKSSATVRQSMVAFAKTKHSMTLMERIGCATSMNESVLLTGETGVGKTFLVQYLADNLGQELIVHNLNQQTDSSDFMGGWKPRDLSLPLRGLHGLFTTLMNNSCACTHNPKFIDSLMKAMGKRKWESVLQHFEKGVLFSIAKLKTMEDEAEASIVSLKEELTVNIDKLNELPAAEKEVDLSPSQKKRGKKKGGSNNVSSNGTDIVTKSKVVAIEEAENIIAGKIRGVEGNIRKFKAEQLKWDEFQEKMMEMKKLVHAAKTSFMFVFEEGTLVKAWREGHWILLDEVNLATTEVLERVATVLGGSDELVVTEKGGNEAIPRHPNFRVFANMNPPTDVGKKDLPPALRSRFTEFYVSDPFDMMDLICVGEAYLSGLSADSRIQEIVNFFLDCVASARSKLCDLDGESKPPHFSLRTLTRALTYIRKATQLYGYHAAIFDGFMMSFASPLQRKFHSVVEQMIISHIFKGVKPSPPTLPKKPTNGQKGVEYIAYEHIWLELGSETPFTNEKFIMTESVKGHVKNIARAVFTRRPVLLEGPTSAGKSSMVQFLAEMTGHKFVRINNHESTEIQEYLGHYVSDEEGKLRFVDGCLTSAVRHGHWVVLDELNLAPTEVLEALNRLLDDNCELFVPDTHEVISPHPNLRIFASQNPSGIYGGRKTLSRAFRNRFLEIIVDDIPTNEIKEILMKRYSMAPSFAEKMVDVMTTLQFRRQSSHLFAGRHGFITPRDLFRWADRKADTYECLARHGFLLLGERCRKAEERQIVRDVIEKTMKVNITDEQVYNPKMWPFVSKYYSLVESLSIKEKIVWTPSMERLFTIVGLCIEHKEPVLLVGETGSSKTTICQIWGAVLQQQLHIINCHQHSEAADFLGSLRPTTPGTDEGLFSWQDGPLLRAMKNGDIFVLDEISLAEDSVLERLNSVLEPSRTITLAEKSTSEVVVAADPFLFLATMNPGGDFGKKELSPALRNRFTEIYVQPITDEQEIELIIQKRMPEDLFEYASKMARVLCSVASKREQKGVVHISIRDVVGWCDFMVATNGRCDKDSAFWHGLDAVLLDGLSVGAGISENSVVATRIACLESAQQQIKEEGATASCLETPFWELCEGVHPPTMPEGQEQSFHFTCPTTQHNTSKILRSCVLKKGIMLEGSPGVGKTSIVDALAKAFKKTNVRINLSEQTDMMDLLGAFLPRPTREDEEGPCFEWSDGILLNAVKEGYWVTLDELNLASQSVLEGLNALLDHRSTIYLPELCREVTAHPDFRIFACQNPLVEGGGRKGLPKSFLNRFTKVRVAAFKFDDLICIARACTGIEDETLTKMVKYSCALQKATMEDRSFGVRGSPWEFNLRDVLRWAKMMTMSSSEHHMQHCPHSFANTLFFQRFRTRQDREAAVTLYNSIFFDLETIKNGGGISLTEHVNFAVDSTGRLIGNGTPLTPEHSCNFTIPNHIPLLLPSQTPLVESVIRCAIANQFCILIGSSSSGKSTILNMAAALLNTNLDVFSMTAGCDTIDLLGGFDQVEGRQGHFEWRDSIIIRAMEEGKWVVLDNANFCSASVLDRLNSLVEPNGMLVVNEQGLVDGKVRIIRPHPNFRLFATIDPKYGEVSRALRNRAVELFTSPLPVPSLDTSALVCYAAASREDPNTCHEQGALVPEGVVISSPQTKSTEEEDTDISSISVDMLAVMCNFHRKFIEMTTYADTTDPMDARISDAISNGAPTIATLLRSIKTAQALGNNPTEALLQCYVRNRLGSWALNKEKIMRVLDKEEETKEKYSLSFCTPLLPSRALISSTSLFVAESRSAGDDDIDCGLSSALALQAAHRAVLLLECVKISCINKESEGGNITDIDAAVYYYLQDALRFSPDKTRRSARDAVAHIEAYASFFPQPISTNWILNAEENSSDEAALTALDTLVGRGLRSFDLSGSRGMPPAVVNSLQGLSVALTEHANAVQRENNIASHSPQTSVMISMYARPIFLAFEKSYSSTPEVMIPILTAATLLNSLVYSALQETPNSDSLRKLSSAIQIAYNVLKRVAALSSELAPSPALLKFGGRPAIKQAEERAMIGEATLQNIRYRRSLPLSMRIMEPVWLQAAARRECGILASMTQSLCVPSDHKMVQAVRSSIESFIALFVDRAPLLSHIDTSAFLTAVSTNSAISRAAILPELMTSSSRFTVGGAAASATPGQWCAAGARALRIVCAVTVKDFGNIQTSEPSKILSYLFDTMKNHIAPQDTAAVLRKWIIGELCWMAASLCPNAVDAFLQSGNSVGAHTLLLDTVEFDPSSITNILNGDEREPSISKVTYRDRLQHIADLIKFHASKSDFNQDNTVFPGGNDMSSVCLAGVLLHHMRMELITPSSLIDPMLKRLVELSINEKEAKYWSDVSSVFQKGDHVIYGLRNETSTLTKAALNIHEEAITRAATSIAKYTPRPENTGAKFVEMVLFEREVLKGVLHQTKIDNFSRFVLHEFEEVHLPASKRAKTETISSGLQPEICAEELESWITLLKQTATEMKQRFIGYEDFMLPFAQSIIAISFFAEAVLIMTTVKNVASGSIPADGLHPQDAAQLISFPHPKPAIGIHTLAVDEHFKELVCLMDASLAEIECAPTWSEEACSDIFDGYSHLFAMIDELEREELRQEQMSVMYKEKALIIEGDDEMNLRRLKDMFPDYEKEFEDIDKDSDDEGAAHNTDENKDGEDIYLGDEGVMSNVDNLKLKTGQRAKMILKGDNGARIRNLIRAHVAVFKEITGTCYTAKNLSRPAASVGLMEEKRLGVFKKRFDAVASMQRNSTIYSSYQEEQTIIGGFQARLKLLNDQVHSSQARVCSAADVAEKVNMAFNVYCDPEPNEAAAIAKCLESLMKQISPLREEYPENPVLQRIERIATRISRYPVFTTPLMRIVTGSEVLLRQCYEWERNASRDVSIVQHINSIASCVLRWRRLELHCWPHIFSSKRNEAATKACGTWIDINNFVKSILNRSFVDGTTGAFTPAAVFSYVSDYLWKSSIGEMNTRLEIIEGFGYRLLAHANRFNHLEARQSSAIFLHLVGFFNQFKEVLSEAEQKLVDPLKEDLAEFCKIMKWEDATYYAVRATTQKSHHKVARILAELEDALRRPALQIIIEKETELFEQTTFGLPPPEDAPSGLSKGAEKKRLQEKANEKRTRKGKKIAAAEEQIVNDAQRLLSTHLPHWSSLKVKTGIEFMEDSSEDILTQIVAMQLPKVSMNQKTRAFKMLIDSIQKAGIRTTHEEKVPEWDVLFSNDKRLKPLLRITESLKECFPRVYDFNCDDNPAEVSDRNNTKPELTTNTISKTRKISKSKDKKGLKKTVTIEDDQKAPKSATSIPNSNVPEKNSLDKFILHSYKLMRYVQKMREYERFPHADLSAAQARKGTGMCESILRQVSDTAEGLEGLCFLKNTLMQLKLAIDKAPLSSDACSSTTGLNNNEIIDLTGSMTNADSASLVKDCHTFAMNCLSFTEQSLWVAGVASKVASDTADTLHCLQDNANKLTICTSQYMAALSPSSEGKTPSSVSPAGYLLTNAELSTLAEMIKKCEEGLMNVINQNSTNCIGKVASELRVDVQKLLPNLLLASCGKNSIAECEVDGQQWTARVFEALKSLEDTLGQLDVSSKSEDGTDGTASFNEFVKTVRGIKQQKEENDASNEGDTDNEEDCEVEDEENTNRPIKDATDILVTALSQSYSLRQAPASLVSVPNQVRVIHSTSEKYRLLTNVEKLSNIVDAIAYWSNRYLQASTRMGTVLTKLMTALLKKGFCKPEDKEEDGDGDGGEGEALEGTGMDDGKGEKDVTDQLDNEDQLMNMKDKEKQEEEQENDDDEKDKDKAADVETDFEADKEKRNEKDDEDEEGSEDDDDDDVQKEMGEVDAEDQRERKKSRKEEKDGEMDDDEGGEAEEIPEDEIGGDDDANDLDEEDEETKDYGNKEKEIRRNTNSDNDSDKEDGDLIGDDESAIYDDNSGEDSDQSGDDQEDGEGSGSDKEGGEEENDDKGSEDSDKSGSEKRENGDKSDDDLDPDRQEDAEMNTNDKSGKEQGAEDTDGEEDDKIEEEGDDKSEKTKDKNDQYHGQQDDEVGQEQRDEKDEEDRKEMNPDDAAGAENEEQDGKEQQLDDAGRSWKKEKKNNQNTQKSDNDQQKKQSEMNPLKALKEAMKRHEKRIKQLNLDKNVQIKEDEETNDKNEDAANTDDENVSEGDEFEITEKGKDEGLAPVDNQPVPSVAENQIEEEKELEEEEDDDNVQKDKAPKDRRVKRENPQDKTQVEDEKNKNKKNKDKKNDKSKIKLQAATDSEEEDENVDEQCDVTVDEEEFKKLERGRTLWYEQESAVQAHAQQLCEQLRLILAPTQADKLRGDYKTGKRINIKKIIPYIASQFKKDRIWLRRTKPNKRSYQILVALDDSLSMQMNKAGLISTQAVALLSKAMQQLEVGEFGILSFGKDTVISHPLAEPFGADSGPKAFSNFTFEQKSTNMRGFLQTSLDYMDAERLRLGGTIRSTTTQLKQIMFILSDGQITEDRTELRKLLARAEENDQVVVLMILDITASKNSNTTGGPISTVPESTKKEDMKHLSTAEQMRRMKTAREKRMKEMSGGGNGSSVLDMKIVEFVGNSVVTKTYLDNFPFPYYIVVQDIPSLPTILADAMKQWFVLMMSNGN